MYWIGECYYAQKKYPDAISTFNELIAKYKDGDKVPAAMLKKGYALVETGKAKRGRHDSQRFDFPFSPVRRSLSRPAEAEGDRRIT